MRDAPDESLYDLLVETGTSKLTAAWLSGTIEDPVGDKQGAAEKVGLALSYFADGAPRAALCALVAAAAELGADLSETDLTDLERMYGPLTAQYGEARHAS